MLSSSYLERFVNICKKYRLNAQNIIDLTNKGGFPDLAQKGSREGSIVAWCAWHRRLEGWGGGRGRLSKPSDIPLSPQMCASLDDRRASQAFWYVDFHLNAEHGSPGRWELDRVV